MTELAIAVAAFVLTHFILSHPLRAPLVAKIGERGFLVLYSVVAIATLIWAVNAYGRTPGEQLWMPPSWTLHAAYLVMLIASILLAGSLLAPSPTLPMAGGLLAKGTDPKGVTGITRHPMMWSFGLWAAVHIAVSGRLDTLILAGGLGFLALVGAKLQDGKKAEQLGEGWAAYAANTSYWPLGAQLSGRAAWTKAWPGILPVTAGIALFALLVSLHPLVIGKSTGLM